MGTVHNKYLVILGMHRSGASVLSGCLHLLGANLGGSLMSANQPNQSGYFDNQDIVLIHDILLRDLKCRWDMVGSLPKDWHKSEAAAQAKEKIGRLLDREFTHSRLWVISDPRLCRMMPLWQDVFQQRQIDPIFVIMIRHPFEVAQSLKSRDGFDLLKGHLLWLNHCRQAMSVCRDQKHIILTYDQLLSDPVSCLEDLSHKLNISFPRSVRQNSRQIIEFARTDLKHCNSKGKSDDMYAPYAWLYDQLRLNQAKAIESASARDGSLDDNSGLSAVQDLDVKGFPLIVKEEDAVARPDTANASEMFDNLLSVISRYEQTDLNREIQRQRRLLEADVHDGALYAQVFFPQSRDEQSLYSEENSRKILLAPEEWQRLSIDIPSPEKLRQQSLRLDPLNTSGIVSISAINLVDASTEEVLWSASEPKAFQEVKLVKDALLLDTENSLLICSTGKDSQLMLPPVPDLPEKPLKLECWVKVSRNLFKLDQIWQERKNNWDSREQDLKTKLEAKEKAVEEWKQKNSNWHSEKHDLEQSLIQQKNLVQELTDKAENQSKELQESHKHTTALEHEQEELKEYNDKLQTELKEQNQVLFKIKERVKYYKQPLIERDFQIQPQQTLKEKTTGTLDSYKDVQYLQKKLAEQEELTRQYFTELARAEKKLAQAQQKVN